METPTQTEQSTTAADPLAPIRAALAAPFPPEQIGVKVQSESGDRGLVVAYQDARLVMDRLDDVAGPGAWEDRYKLEMSGERRIEVSCALTVRGVTKEDCGAGAALKDAFSDALKRAAVKFGVGRYLYRLEKPWVDLGKKGRIKDPGAARRALGLYDAWQDHSGSSQQSGSPRRSSQRGTSPQSGSGGPSSEELEQEIHRLGNELFPDGTWAQQHWPALQEKYERRNLSPQQLRGVLGQLREREEQQQESPRAA